MKNLDSYRKEKQNWKEFSYFEAKSKERGKFDKNEKQRYAILISLQYDFQESDEELIRFLFEQEIIARENDDFQGIGNALRLGAYLLAKFKNPKDIPIFYRAKFANFDTGCGFDREFIYFALKEQTEEYVLHNHSDLYNEIKGDFSSMSLSENIDIWWEKLSSLFPEKEKDESLLELYKRNIYFGNKRNAKEFLDKWNKYEPDSELKNGTLRYAYIELGEHSKAIELVKKELQKKETNWDRASCLRDLLRLYTQLKASPDGLNVIKELDEEFSQFKKWKQVGLGRIAVHDAFEYALASKNIKIAREAFKIAHDWFKEMDNIAFVGLEAGWKAAKKCGFSSKARMYKKLAMKEKRRIKTCNPALHSDAKGSMPFM